MLPIDRPANADRRFDQCAVQCSGISEIDEAHLTVAAGRNECLQPAAGRNLTVVKLHLQLRTVDRHPSRLARSRT
jgi:hypothetical protein